MFNGARMIVFDWSPFSKRLDGSIKDTEQKQDSLRDGLAKIQQQIQQAQVKAAAKAWQSTTSIQAPLT